MTDEEEDHAISVIGVCNRTNDSLANHKDGHSSEAEVPASSPLDETADHKNRYDSLQTRGRRRGKTRYVEPVVFLTLISRVLFEIVLTNVIEVQYCKSVLSVHEVSSCLNHTAPHFSTMQKYASNFLMIQMLLFSVCSVVISVFLASWSDTFGRRPVILCGTIADTLNISMWILATYTDIHPNYFILFDLPKLLGGGYKLTFMAARCYLCDVTTTEARIFRMGVLAGLDFLGALSASLLFPYLQKIGYSFPLIFGLFTAVLAFLYSLIFLEESVSVPKDQRKLVSMNPFQWSHVKSIYITCFTKQSPIVVKILIFAILLDAVSWMQLVGQLTVFYLFLQKALGWTVNDYSRLLVIITIVQAFAAFTSTSKLLNLTDLTILSLLIGINFSSAVVFYFGTQPWLVYVTAPLSRTLRIDTSIIQSFLSKIVPANDIGKVFALCGIGGTISPFLGSPIYSTVYNQTMDTHPKAIFLVSATTAIVMAILWARMHFLYRKHLSWTSENNL